MQWSVVLAVRRTSSRVMVLRATKSKEKQKRLQFVVVLVVIVSVEKSDRCVWRHARSFAHIGKRFDLVPVRCPNCSEIQALPL